jgi:TPR repeat protein
MDVMEIISRIDAAFANDDYRAAFEIAKPYAEQGHAWAQTCIGSLYQCGLGVNMDLHEAERYFREAAEQGYAGAWYSLGVLYEVGGEDFPDDLEKAKQYYQKASNLGYFPGQPYTAPK